MTRKVKLSDEERIAAVQEYLDGKGSFRSLAMKYFVSYTCIKEWVERAKAQGMLKLMLRFCFL